MKESFNKIKPMLIAAAPYIIVGGIALYVGNKLLKSVTKNIKDIFGKGETKEDLLDAVAAEQKRLERLGEKLSYSELQYIGFANTIHSSMQGFGTDQKGIKSILSRMKNDLDMTELIKAFGIKPYYLTVQSAGLWKNMDLAGWIQEEARNAWTGNIDTEEIKEYNDILAGNNITYRF